jgi:hypothetical protein
MHAMAFLSDPTEIRKWMKKNAKLLDKKHQDAGYNKCVKIDVDGQITVTCSVALNLADLHGIRVKFKHVDGDFALYAGNYDMQDLSGTPDYVGGGFHVFGRTLQSLSKGPSVVKRGYSIISKLTKIDGLAHIIGNRLSLYVEENLPLLGIFFVRFTDTDYSIKFNGRPNDNERMLQLETIFRRYLHLGPAGMMPCAAELIRAGFSGNAHL